MAPQWKPHSIGVEPREKPDGDFLCEKARSNRSRWASRSNLHHPPLTRTQIVQTTPPYPGGVPETIVSMAWNPQIPADHNEPPFRCPTSGVLLGAVVKCFDLSDPRVGGERAAKHLGSAPSLGRRAREYFRGAWVAEEKRLEICRWTVLAILEAGLLRGLVLPADVDGSAPPKLEDFLTSLLDRWLAEWDFVYHRGSSGWPHLPRHLSGFVLGRQVVIDLALRAAALIQLMGGCPPESVIPYAGDDRPGRVLVHALMERSGRRLTREGLAAAIGVEKSTVDAWMDENTVPREENIRRLAEVFAGVGNNAEVLLAWLRVQYGLIGLRNRLDQEVGHVWARDLFAALACFVQWTLGMHEQSKLDRRVFLLGQLSTLKMGRADASTHWVLNTWLKIEDDKFWTEDILAAQKHGAARRIQDCFEVIGDWPRITAEWDAGPQTRLLPAEERRQRQVVASLVWMSPCAFADDLYPEALKGGPAEEVEWWTHLAKGHMACGEYAQAVPLWRKAVNAEPENADHRCHYGISLWHATPACDFDEALVQLRRACELRPDWDYPVAEIGRIYLHRGWTDHALQHFEQASRALIESSQDCSFTLGIALVRLGRFHDAKAAADRACGMDPTHADAWDMAAECAFQLGDKIEGARCARKALRLGLRRSYDRWVRPIRG